MTLRLVVVSAIACLGLSLPSTERLERWWRGGTDRNGEQLAGWAADTDGRFVIVADALEVGPRAPLVETPAPAQRDEAETAEWLTAAAYEAAPPTDSALEPTAMVLPEPSAAAVLASADESNARLLVDWEEAQCEMSLAEIVWPAGDDVAAGTSVAIATPVEAPADDQAFSAVVEELVRSFAQDAATVAAAQATRTTPAVPVFEPMVIADESQDVAYVLNRAAEGLELPTPAATAVSQRHGNRLSHAMRLTREAVNAWASLLHGPALVTLER